MVMNPSWKMKEVYRQTQMSSVLKETLVFCSADFSDAHFPPLLLCLPAVPETTRALSSIPLWDRPQWEHGEEHPQQLHRHAHTHDEVQPEGGGGSSGKPENRVQFLCPPNCAARLSMEIYLTHSLAARNSDADGS